MSPDPELSAPRDAEPPTVKLRRSGATHVAVDVVPRVPGTFAFHLYRGSDRVAMTPYGRGHTYRFPVDVPGVYRCRVFVADPTGQRTPVASEPLRVDFDAPSYDVDSDPVPLGVTRQAALPSDSDYSRHLPNVSVWSSLKEFTSADTWHTGVHVVLLGSGLHLDVLLGGDVAGIPPDRCLPVVLSGAVSTRNEALGPFLSGVGLAESVDSPFVAISDPTLNVESTLNLAWYAGRAGDGLQEHVLSLLTAVSDRFTRELVLIGGSGGGFAALWLAARLQRSVSAMVWNPQTDLLDYLPASVENYLVTALGQPEATVTTWSRHERSEALRRGGIEHDVVVAPPNRHFRRLLYLQNAADGHVITHAAPFLERAGYTHVGGGRWVGPDEHLVLISAFGEGHNPPPRAVTVNALGQMLRADRLPSDIIDDLMGRKLLPNTDLDLLPRDLRPEVEHLREHIWLTASVDSAGVVRAGMHWTGLPNRLGGIRTTFSFSGPEGTFERIHQANAVEVRKPPSLPDEVAATVRDGFHHPLFTMAAPVEPVVQLARCFIVGSCVSRDTFEFLDPGWFELRGYVARQSICSAFGIATNPAVEPADLDSSFQRRMLEWDATSALPGLLRDGAREVDLVIWDLVDERLGLIEHPDGTITTDSVEQRALRGSPDSDPSTRHIPFGSTEHLGRFTNALSSWRELLDTTGLLSRTILIAPLWATETTEGDVAPASFGLTAEEANRLTGPYVDAIVSALGIPVLGRDLNPRVLASHQWGPAPFHYDDPTYVALSHEISRAAAALVEPFGWKDDISARTRIPTVEQRDPSKRPSPPTVSITVRQRQVSVAVTGPDVAACAFHLYQGTARVSTTPYGSAREHQFEVNAPGIYRCRAFVRTSTDDRIPAVSRPVRVQ